MEALVNSLETNGGGDPAALSREQLEAEVKALLQKAEANAMRILKENRKELERLAQGLLAHETLDRKEIDLVLAGKKLPAALKPQAAG